MNSREPLALVWLGDYDCCFAGRTWRGAGVVERAGLENRCTLLGTEGSNPSLSAKCLCPISHVVATHRISL